MQSGSSIASKAAAKKESTSQKPIDVLPPEVRKERETPSQSKREEAPSNIEDIHGHLFKSYYLQAGGNQYSINQYDNWVGDEIRKQVGGSRLQLSENSFIEFQALQPWVSPQITPALAIIMGQTYSAGLRVQFDNVTYKDNKPISREKVDVKTIVDMPVMVGSSLCLSKKVRTEEELMSLGICDSDPRGYFIVQGTARNIRLQEQNRLNKIMVFRGIRLNSRKSTADENRLQARLTVPGPRGTSVTYLECNQKDEIKIFLRFMGKKYKEAKGKKYELAQGNASLPIFKFIRIFWVLVAEDGRNTVLTFDDYIGLITRMVRPEWRSKVEQYLYPTMKDVTGTNRNLLKESVVDDLIYYTNKAKIPFDPLSDADIEGKLNFFKNGILDDLLPNVESILPTIKETVIDENGQETIIESNANQLWARFDTVCEMTARLAEVRAGLRQENDRNGYDNKRVVGAEDQMKQLFGGLWSRAIDYTQREISKLGSNISPSKAVSMLVENAKLTEKIRKCFTTAVWGIDDAWAKQNITQPVKRDNLISMISDMRRIGTPANPRSRNLKLRQVHLSQVGFVCMAQTPEGQTCGLVKNMAIGASLSLSRNIVTIRTKIMRSKSFWLGPQKDPDPKDVMVTYFPVSLNSIVIGWSKKELLNEIRSWRRANEIKYDISAIFSDGVQIWTDGSRLIRPLLLVENDELVVRKLGLENASFATLLSKGALEFVDPLEQEYTTIALSEDDLKMSKIDPQVILNKIDSVIKESKINKGKLEYQMLAEDQKQIEDSRIELQIIRLRSALKVAQQKGAYTHCELDASSVLSVAGSLLPHIETSQATRGSFGCKILEQSIGRVSSIHNISYDTSMKILQYPSPPLFETVTNEILGVDDLPIGQTMTIAICPYEGYDQEDALIFNAATVERYMYTKFSTHEAKAERDPKNFIDEFTIPEHTEGNAWKYSHLGPDGLPYIGVEITPDMCIIGKLRKRIDNQKKATEIIDMSIYASLEEHGRIESVVVVKKDDKIVSVLVRIIQVRIPQVGDKFAFNPGQKSTISLILNPEDMPQIVSGPINGPRYPGEKYTKRPTSYGQIVDVIVNPHIIPSRMTLGPLIEALFSYKAAMMGKRMNAASFKKFDLDELRRFMKEAGFNSNGLVKLRIGSTGEEIAAEIFAGPIYMECLKHNVSDKIQAASEAKIDKATHQAKRGKKREGAIKFGGMEVDTTIGHGAGWFLEDRLLYSSDAFQALYCQVCQVFAVPSLLDFDVSCRNCGRRDSGTFGVVTVPHIWKTVFQQANSVNIFFYHRTAIKESED